MCGIILLKHFSLPQEKLQHRLEHGLSRLQHRGPDASNSSFRSGIAIGHTRLSIIDIASNSQPLEDPTKRFTLTYNGEVYNYRELKQQLSTQWEFLTNGDTEVILAGLILQGTKFINKLEGMWAFALWDNREQSLLLSRDRIGKKPLYFSHSGKNIACASEIPALTALLDKPPTEDLSSTADYFRYGFYLPGYTAYNEIQEVLPGHNYIINAQGKLSKHQYWQLNPHRSPNKSPKEAKEEIHSELHRAIKKRMVADVEVGAFLSGGIDSSLIVHHLQSLDSKNLKTFTLGFSSKSFDESSYAQEIVDHYKTEHYLEVIKTWEGNLLTDLISNHVGQPFADPSLLPTAKVSQLAAKHVKVALSGDGADELFSGYERYKARSIMQWYTRLPKTLRRNTEKLIKYIPEPNVHHSRSLIKKAHLFVNLMERSGSETPYVAPRFQSDTELAKLLPSIHSLGNSTTKEVALGDIEKMMYQDTLIYLPQDILQKVDRASMANSLETRAPFLDHHLIESAFSYPLSAHRGGNTNKKLLHLSHEGETPNAIWKRKKQGFSVPISEWFKSEMGEHLESLIRETDSPVSQKHALLLLDRHRKGYKDHGFTLWQIFVYYLWRRQL